MARQDKVREALEAVLSAYDGYIDTDQLDKLAEAIGEARKTLAETQPGVLTPRQALAKHLIEYHPRVKISTRDTYESLGKKHGHEHHQMTITSHYHEGPNYGPSQRPPGWKTGLDVVLLPPRKGY